MEGLNYKLNKSQKEHVTKYFYENSKKFKIYNFNNLEIILDLIYQLIVNQI